MPSHDNHNEQHEHFLHHQEDVDIHELVAQVDLHLVFVVDGSHHHFNYHCIDVLGSHDFLDARSPYNFLDLCRLDVPSPHDFCNLHHQPAEHHLHNLVH